MPGDFLQLQRRVHLRIVCSALRKLRVAILQSVTYKGSGEMLVMPY